LDVDRADESDDVRINEEENGVINVSTNRQQSPTKEPAPTRVISPKKLNKGAVKSKPAAIGM
jgi:hypothetical protein